MSEILTIGSKVTVSQLCPAYKNTIAGKNGFITRVWDNDEKELVFYDVDVFPNLFLVTLIYAGEGQTVVRMIKLTSVEIENLMMKFRYAVHIDGLKNTTREDGCFVVSGRDLIPHDMNDFAREANLSTRTINCIIRAGICTVEELVEHTPSDLVKIRNFGRKSFEELERALKNAGLSLKKKRIDL